MGCRTGGEAGNVVVPAENLLGGQGNGFSIAQHQFNRFRLRLGGCALGMDERSQQLAIEYANSREVFGDNQAIQWMLTDSQYDIESICWNTYYAAWYFTSQTGPHTRERTLSTQMTGRISQTLLNENRRLLFCEAPCAFSKYRFPTDTTSIRLQRRSPSSGLLRCRGPWPELQN
jgi:hypothetical protein